MAAGIAPMDPQIARLPSIEPAAAPQAVAVDANSADAAEEGEAVEKAVEAEENIEEVIVVETVSPLTREWDLWKGSVELGLNGAEGNTKTFNMRFGIDAERKTDHSILSFDLDYHKTDSDYVETANRAFLDSRFEQLYEDSRWTSFVHNTVDYDEFQSFDSRWTADLGLGYQCIKSDSTSLSTRCGAGVSQEVGGPDSTYVPEAVFGLEFSHKLTDRQKLKADVEYTPDVTGFDNYRLRTRATWEVLIDREMNLSLKFSVTDRYNSMPNGKRPNDLDYSVVLLWKF